MKEKGVSVHLSASADSAVRVDLWTVLFPWQIELELRVWSWLKQENRYCQGTIAWTWTRKKIWYIAIYTYIATWKKNYSALRVEVADKMITTRSIHLKYPAELNQTAHACHTNKQHNVSTCYTQMTSPRHDACLHTVTQKQWENFSFWFTAQITENFCLWHLNFQCHKCSAVEFRHGQPYLIVMTGSTVQGLNPCRHWLDTQS